MRGFHLTALLILLLPTETAAAADLADYHRRVYEAVGQVQLMSDESGGDAKECVGRIKELLPKSEEVKAADQVVTVDNSWLHGMLDAYENERNEKKQEEKLSEISERLSALDGHVAQAEETASNEAAGPKEKIGEILARSSYREKTDDRLTAMIKEVRRKVINFISDLLRRIFGAVGAGSGANLLFLALIVIGLGAAVIFAVRMLRQPGGAKRSDKKRTVLGEEVEEGVSSADLANAALTAARAGDFRSAMRKLYISLLYELAERELIEIEAHATNREYLDRVSRFGPLVAPMRYLTDRFDYFWYGMFDSSEEDFRQYLERYSEAMERARSVRQHAAKA